MHIPLLLLMALLPPQEQLESELRRQERQIQQLEGQVRQLENRSRELERELQRPFCSAEIRQIGGVRQRTVPPGGDSLVATNLFSAVSLPSGTCLPAEIRLTATYLDDDGNAVCSGVIVNLVRQREPTAIINLDIRPWNFREFVRWRNEPPQTNSGARILSCLGPDGQTEVAPTDLERVRTLRVLVTVLPPRGGLSTVELELNLQR